MSCIHFPPARSFNHVLIQNKAAFWCVKKKKIVVGETLTNTDGCCHLAGLETNVWQGAERKERANKLKRTVLPNYHTDPFHRSSMAVHCLFIASKADRKLAGVCRQDQPAQTNGHPADSNAIIARLCTFRGFNQHISTEKRSLPPPLCYYDV